MGKTELENHWPWIAHLSAEDMLQSVVIVGKKLKNIGSEGHFTVGL